MRKNTFILLLLVCGCLTTYAQERYRINWTINTPNTNCNCKDGNPRVWDFNFRSSGDLKVLYPNEKSYPASFGGSVSGSFELEVNSTITLSMRSKSNIRKAKRDCSGSYTRTFNVNDIICSPKTFTPPFVPEKTHNDNASCFDVDIIFNYAQPIINIIQPTNTLIGFDDDFNVTVNSKSMGFSNSVYNWQYQTISSGTPSLYGWMDMPNSTDGKSAFSITPSNFLNINDIGKRLYLRVETCNGLVSENHIFYNLTRSAPHFNSAAIKNTTCYDEIDGSVTFNFDRALRARENLSVTLNKIITDGGDYSEENIENDILNNNYTISNLPSGNYIAQMLGGGIPAYGGVTWNSFVESPNHKITFTINRPTPVEFSTTKVDVWCNGGNDGKINITANGGTGNYEYQVNGGNWVAFSNGIDHTLTGLASNTYQIRVRDTNGCIAKKIVKNGGGKIVGLGAEITETIEITEPDDPVAVDFVFSKEPTAFGFSNGRIRAQITGGTPLANGKYNYTWVHSNGTNWSTFTEILNADGWFLTLENAIAGIYKLTVTDANHASARNRSGCTIINAQFILKEPPLLELAITETKTISCNTTNTFGDPYRDGELTATATGGVPFDPLIDGKHAYVYTWKKKNALGAYQIITGANNNVLSNIDTGDYAVNIEDAKGVIIGTYTNNSLVSTSDALYTLTQPDVLQVTLSKVDVFCNLGNDGAIDATIKGGTGNYTISWNTGAATEDIDALVSGTYTIDVSDEKGCQAQATITIDAPHNPLKISYAYFAPTFTGATNGWIEATITGGTPLDSGTYTYVWEDAKGTNLNTQATENINATSFVIKLNDLGTGVYNVTIEDKNHPLAINAINCTIINSGYELFEPEPLTATVQLNMPISCNGTNTYGNPYSDGILEVIAEGGVQLQPTDNNGLPYHYTWKKETSPGIWTMLTTQTTNIATGLDAGNYAVNIEDANGIIIGVYQKNVLAKTTDVSYLFKEPPLLKLTIEKQDVYCYNGSDSWAKAIITGGIPPYDILWSNGATAEQTTSLSQGIYNVAITDSRGCQVTGSIQINQPTEPLSINYTAFAAPSTGGAVDGWIEAQIAGGTNFVDGSYTYYWQDKTGVVLNAQTTTSIINGVFQIRLNNIPKGSFYLTIEDANHPLATTGDGCTIIDDGFILYDPIEAVVSVHTPISCHGDNSFNNPFSDGALQVAITGGLPFNTGQPYIYSWKKKNIGGTLDDLNQNSNMATHLSDGHYTLNVEDSRGIVIGIYESLDLLYATDIIFDFMEPDLLEVSLTSTEISCEEGNNGTATVNVMGGIAPYDIQWSNGNTSTTAINLIAGNHIVYVTDIRGCQVTGQITIGQPGGLNIEVIQQTNPSCFEGNDGMISLNVTGGTLPYTYTWDMGTTVTTIDSLSEGTYTFKLTDANGCTAFKKITLEHPEETIIDLGADRILCIDQVHNLNGSILDPDAIYFWVSDNGFSATTPQITVTEVGTYKVTATSSLGCMATDEIIISVSNTAIDAEFLLSSQAYIDEDVILFNVSSPLGETSQWIIPDNVTIIDKDQTSITLHFPEVSSYKIGLISTQGDCYQEVYKNIVVEQSSGFPNAGDVKNPYIEEFTLTPNPSNGQFEVSIKLSEKGPIALRIFDNLGSFIFSQPTMQATDEYIIPINLSMATGTYLVVLETAKETQIKRLIKF